MASKTPAKKPTKVASPLDQVREAFRKKRLTQAELGRLAGLDRATISRIFSGERNAEPGTLARLQAALGLPVSADVQVDGAHHATVCAERDAATARAEKAERELREAGKELERFAGLFRDIRDIAASADEGTLGRAELGGRRRARSNTLAERFAAEPHEDDELEAAE